MVLESNSRRAKIEEMEHVIQPPTSSKAWLNKLLDFCVGVVHMLASHEPIEIENEVRLISTRAEEDERKKVSRSAVGSQHSIYWYSTDVINLFSPTSNHDTNIYGVLLERVALLEAAIESSKIGGLNKAFYKLIEGNPKDASEFSLAKLT